MSTSADGRLPNSGGPAVSTRSGPMAGPKPDNPVPSYVPAGLLKGNWWPGTIARMTIREHFQSVLKRTNYVTVLAGIAVIVAFLWRYPNATKQQSWGFFLAVGVVFGVAIGIFTRIVYRCPRCHASFQKLRIKQLGRWPRDMRFFWQLWDACPQCHVSFDDPWN